MSTDKCSEEIYKKGNVALIMEGQSAVIEAIVNAAVKHSGLRIDWHYFAGRVVIKTLDDVDDSRAALESCIPRVLT